HGKFGDDEALFGDLVCELAVLGGVDLIDAAAENSDRVPRGFEGCFVRCCIDAASHSAGDSQARSGQVFGEAPCDRRAIGSGTARATTPIIRLVSSSARPRTKSIGGGSKIC